MQYKPGTPYPKNSEKMRKNSTTCSVICAKTKSCTNLRRDAIKLSFMKFGELVLEMHLLQKFCHIQGLIKEGQIGQLPRTP